ncbi:Arm DNA-binding domain-containing protein [Caballeronia mineralivorans]|uniref:Arm DNA-binding domain-containing protein n=1 Tax=Caballeronia mineralivorans TaxID=2010198 RepID=UPI0038991E01
MFQLDPNFERCIFRCIFVFTRVHERVYNDVEDRTSSTHPARDCERQGCHETLHARRRGAALYPHSARWHEALAMEYLFAGKTKTMALGTWPEVTEREARAAHLVGREQLRKGVDPMRERREAKAHARR